MLDTVHPPKEDYEWLVRHIEATLNLPRFRKLDLLIQALTHWSYTRDVAPARDHNEWFEFFGDQKLRSSFDRYVREHGYPEELARKLRPVALSNGYIGAHALKMPIFEVALFGPAFKRNLLADAGGPAARLVAADLFEAILYAIWRDQGFPSMHKYASSVLWDHAAKIPPVFLEGQEGRLRVPIDDVVVDVTIDPAERILARSGFLNATLTHIVSAVLPNGVIVYGKGESLREARRELYRKLNSHSSSSSKEAQD